MKLNLNSFKVPDNVRGKLNIQIEKKETVKDKILKIFTDAEKIGKKELSVNEVTAAYYNLYSANGKEKIKTKKEISVFLYLLKHGKNGSKKLESDGRGKYWLNKKDN